MRTIFLLLTLLFSLHLFSQSNEAGVKQTINGLFDAMRRTDTAAMRAAFAPGARLQSVITGRDGMVHIITESIDSFLVAVARPHIEIYDERIVFEQVYVDGDLAQTWTPYEFFVGNRFSHCGVDAYQLVKLGGAWKILNLVDTRRRQGCK